MRRSLSGVVLGTLLAMLLAGCGKPAGVDGDIVDDQTPIGKPTFTPVATACLAGGYRVIRYLSSYNAIDCGLSHSVEITYVGAFSGSDADSRIPPVTGSDALRAAFAECDQRTDAYLSDDWRIARLSLGVSVPSIDGWSGGDRWYACELAQLADVEETNAYDKHEGNLKDALSGPSPLRLGCYTAPEEKDDIGRVRAVPCNQPHHAEFIGIYKGPDSTYATANRSNDLLTQGCYSVMSRFVGVPLNDIDTRAGVFWYLPDEDGWRNGDRGVRCYLWVPERNLKKSMHNAGPSGLPQY